MKLALPAVLAMASLASAEYFTSYTRCSWLGDCYSDGVWHGDDGDHDFNANDGCHSGGLPSGLTQICIDWGDGRKRAHAYSTRYPKRCYRKTGDYNCDFHGTPSLCANWDESPCNW